MYPLLTSCISRATFAVALCVGSTAVAQAPSSQPTNSSTSVATSAAATTSRAPLEISLIEDALAHAPSISNHTSLEASVGVTNAWQLTAAIAVQTVLRGNQPLKQFHNFSIGTQRSWSFLNGSLEAALGVELEFPLVTEDGALPVWSPTFNVEQQFSRLHSLSLAADGKYGFDIPRRNAPPAFEEVDAGKPFEVHASAVLPFRMFSLTTEVSYLPDGLLESARGTYVAPGVAIPVKGAFELGLSVSQHMTAPRTGSLGFRVMYQF